MDEPSTCGEGLASRSFLPGKLGEFLASQARILEAHVALDPTDANARKRGSTLATLVTGHRDVADRLSGISSQMAEYRNLPMAAHDEAAMSDAVAHKAFANFVRLEQELATAKGFGISFGRCRRKGISIARPVALSDLLVDRFPWDRFVRAELVGRNPYSLV